MSNGAIAWQGASRIDRTPIVLILTWKTRNPKTGDMIQSWILKRDVSPTVAINTGEDYGICGDCPLRGVIQDGRNRKRGCYVSARNAPLAIWKAYQRGGYPEFSREQHASLLAGRSLRLGAYGDPVAVPLTAWKPLIRLSRGWTGYTHQWGKSKFARWKPYVMASTHSVAESERAQSLGWRTFRTAKPGESPSPAELICPASAEAGHSKTCAQCLACNGACKPRPSVVISAHGSRAVISSALRVIQ